LRIIWISANFSFEWPWEKFRRATSTPARTPARERPARFGCRTSVATILARRWVETSDRFNGANDIRFAPGEDFLGGQSRIYAGSLHAARRMGPHHPFFYYAASEAQWSVGVVTDLRGPVQGLREQSLPAGVPEKNAVEFRAQQRAERGDVKPDQRGDACAKGA